MTMTRKKKRKLANYQQLSSLCSTWEEERATQTKRSIISSEQRRKESHYEKDTSSNKRTKLCSWREPKGRLSLIGRRFFGGKNLVLSCSSPPLHKFSSFSFWTSFMQESLFWSGVFIGCTLIETYFNQNSIRPLPFYFDPKYTPVSFFL